MTESSISSRTRYERPHSTSRPRRRHRQQMEYNLEAIKPPALTAEHGEEWMTQPSELTNQPHRSKLASSKRRPRSAPGLKAYSAPLYMHVRLDHREYDFQTAAVLCEAQKSSRELLRRSQKREIGRTARLGVISSLSKGELSAGPNGLESPCIGPTGKLRRDLSMLQLIGAGTSKQLSYVGSRWGGLARDGKPLLVLPVTEQEPSSPARQERWL